MGKNLLSAQSNLSIHVYTDGMPGQQINLQVYMPPHSTLIWLSVPDARAAIAALSQGVAELEAKFPELRACDCGATIGESGVIEDGKATCGKCYLAANGAPMVDGEVEP